MGNMTKRGSADLWSCLACNRARIAVIAAYTERGQKQLWSKMSKAQKDAEIAANKGKYPGRGRKFPVELSETVPFRYGQQDLFRFVCSCRTF